MAFRCWSPCSSSSGHSCSLATICVASVRSVELPSRDTWLASRAKQVPVVGRCDSYETEERGLDDKDDTVRGGELLPIARRCSTRFDRNPGDGGS